MAKRKLDHDLERSNLLTKKFYYRNMILREKVQKSNLRHRTRHTSDF